MRRFIVIVLNVVVISIAGIIYIIGFLFRRVVKEPFVSMAAIATIIYAFFAYHQWKVMEGQLAEMRAERRPWIALVNTVIANPLTEQGDGARTISIKFTLRNTGKDPSTLRLPRSTYTRSWRPYRWGRRYTFRATKIL
jgi:hypothetical protein